MNKIAILPIESDRKAIELNTSELTAVRGGFWGQVIGGLIQGMAGSTNVKQNVKIANDQTVRVNGDGNVSVGVQITPG
jgi:hypothetical protein